jgi:hypothetical protein
MLAWPMHSGTGGTAQYPEETNSVTNPDTATTATIVAQEEVEEKQTQIIRSEVG